MAPSWSRGDGEGRKEGMDPSQAGPVCDLGLLWSSLSLCLFVTTLQG